MFPWSYTLGDIFRAVLYEITAHAQQIICVLCFVKGILVKRVFYCGVTVLVTGLVRDIFFSFPTRRKLEFRWDVLEQSDLKWWFRRLGTYIFNLFMFNVLKKCRLKYLNIWVNDRQKETKERRNIWLQEFSGSSLSCANYVTLSPRSGCACPTGKRFPILKNETDNTNDSKRNIKIIWDNWK